MSNKNEVLIKDVSEKCLIRLSAFCSKLKNKKFLIKNPIDKRAAAICIDLVTLKYYFTNRITFGYCGMTVPATTAYFLFNNVDEFFSWYKKIYLPLKNIVLIKHIPHSSLEFPKHISLWIEDYKYNLKMADLGIDILFKYMRSTYFPYNCPDIPVYEIKAKYSRLYCDVERFKDDSKEPMAKFGQGYVYEKYYDGKSVIRFGEFSYKDADLYYDEHHKRLNSLVREQIEKGKDVLILDLHSYSDDLALAIKKKAPFPDVCIGINKKYYKKEIVDLIISIVKKKGYTYRINYPYRGSIIPSDVLSGKIKGNVYSIMIEVNKRIYL